MRDSYAGTTDRLDALARSLEAHITDLGYQGLTDAERETATVLAALQIAIERGTTRGLAAATQQWASALPA